MRNWPFAGGELLAAGGVLHDEEAVAGEAEVGGVAGGVERPLREIRGDAGQLDAGADLDAGLAGLRAVRGRRAASVLLKLSAKLADEPL